MRSGDNWRADVSAAVFDGGSFSSAHFGVEMEKWSGVGTWDGRWCFVYVLDGDGGIG